MVSLRLVAGVLLSCITESLAEATCKFKYEDYFGGEQTREFNCPDCCCDEPYKSHCCRCWWWNVIGPCVGLLVTICVGVAMCCFYRHYRKKRQTRALQAGQVLQPPTPGVQKPAYSQPGAPGGQSTSIQPAWTFSSSGQPANPGQALPTVSYPGQGVPQVSYPNQQLPAMTDKQLY